MPRQIDLKSYLPKFFWLPVDVVKHAFQAPLSIIKEVLKMYKFPFPACNVCRSEDAATYTIYADTPVNDNGATIAQFLWVPAPWLVMSIH